MLLLCSSSLMDFVSPIGYESPHMTQFCSPHMRNFAGRIDISGCPFESSRHDDHIDI
jgi:hypothetical protein